MTKKKTLAAPIPDRRKPSPRPKGKKKPRPEVQEETRVLADETEPSFPIVGVGASAGGIEACTQLLANIPADAGVAIVIVQHLAPTHTSLLPEVLREATAMPVMQVEPGTPVLRNHVYVIPPNTDLALRDGRLELVPRRDTSRPHLAIDFFFRSLAEVRQTKAIGVVLSGTASDGTAGLAAIKAEGGISFAQAPDSAKYPAMPQNAITAGNVDFVLSPKEIAAELSRIARHPYMQRAPSQAESEDVPKDERPAIERICILLRQETGVDFCAYKPSTIRRRIERRMTMTRMDDFDVYYKFLKKNPDEVQALQEDMLIHVTAFFRDPEVFEALQRRVFPEIMQHKAQDALVRMWVPGCSTGEEVYSIAIALADHFGGSFGRNTVQIFGSDVSQTSIDRARSATYPESIVRDVGEDRLRRFFTKVDEGYRVAKAIRESCVFVRHDVTRDPPFTRMDLISCRNVLIYFGAELQKKALPIFHYALNQPGFLLLGRSETIGGFNHLFSLEDRANKIYTRKPAAVRLTPYLPLGVTVAERREQRARTRDGGMGAVDLPREADRLLQTRYGPAAVVVNEALEILCTRGRTGPYLELAPGEAKLSLLSMAREGLLSDLRIVMYRAKKEDTTVRREGGHVRVNDELRAVNIEVTPFRAPPTARERYFVVAFEDATGAAGPKVKETKTQRGKRTAGEKVAQDRLLVKLGEELAATKEYLQSVIEDHTNTNEELAATNEELLSANEELQSANEELETAKEELQSANEELTIVNDELQTRNNELSLANNDLLNVMASIDVPIVLVDLERRIRRFTPQAGEVMNLIPSDLGRPIRDINPNLEIADLDLRIDAVIESVTAKETEVRDLHGHWYRLSVRPYKTAEKVTEGAVVSLVDIDAPRRALEERGRLLEQVRQERSLLDAVIQQMPAGVIIVDASSRKVLLWNKRVEEILRQPLSLPWNIEECRLYHAYHADGSPYPPEDLPLSRSLKKGEIVRGETVLITRGDGTRGTVLMSSAPVQNKDEQIIACVAVFLDISEEVLERERTEHEQRLLVEAGALLSDVVDFDKTIQKTARLVVPTFADWCLLDLEEDDKPLRQVAAAHADPAKEKIAVELARHLPPDPALEHGVGLVMRTGKAEVYPIITDENWMAHALGAEHPSILRDLGARSYICVPLKTRAHVFGVLSLIRGEAHERYDQRSLLLAEELGRRFAAAIDDAWLYRSAMEAIRLRNEFFAIASHELKNPMGALLLQVQNMRRAATRATEGKIPADVADKSLAQIERQVLRLDELMNALLDVSRIASGRLSLQLEECDFASIVEDVVSRFDAQAKRAGSTITVHASGSVRGRWDRMRVEQVVSNLLSNAIKYGLGKPIDVFIEADASRARLSVRDQGIGIAAEDLTRVFGRFERAVSARQYAGLGMGLFITLQIVETHGGKIKAVSEPNKGSTFTVELPLEPRAAAPPPDGSHAAH